MARRILIILVLLVLALPLAARSESGSLSGTVRDAKTGKGVSGASVKVKYGAAGSVAVYTDTEGRFIFSNIPAGSGFTIKAYKSNYEEWKGNCPEIKAGARATKDISLNPAGGGTGTVGTTGSGGDGTVSGTVTSSGKPLAGVTVKIGGKSAVTSAAGAYSIKIAPGSYTIEAKKDGFKKFEDKITVAPGGSATRNIDLKPKK